MNKRGHVLNAILLSVGLAFVFEPSASEATWVTALQIGVPITLGALFPDVDTAFGEHRKTLHNLALLVGFFAFPLYFDNLYGVWIGILTHYVLDVAGSKRGIALFYPLWGREFGLPVGVEVSSDHAAMMTLFVTAVELIIATALILVILPELGVAVGQEAFGL